MHTHAIARTHTRPMRERGAAKAIFNDRGRALVLISAFLLIYREPASQLQLKSRQKIEGQ